MEKLLGWSNQDMGKVLYYDICEKIANDEFLFKNFKQNPNYTTILEHVDYKLGLEYAKLIENKYDKAIKNYVFDKLDEIKENDSFGNPLVFDYDNFGAISPTTIRYIKVILDLLSNDIDLTNKNVVEIGGGYGGQCLLLSKFFKFKKYTILDLESVTKLQTKYLNKNNVQNVLCTTINNCLGENFDFVISNYAFAELNKDFQNLYLEKIIKNSKSGYFQINPDADECYKSDELRNIFSKFSNPLFFLDEPMNLKYPNNFIFMFKQ